MVEVEVVSSARQVAAYGATFRDRHKNSGDHLVQKTISYATVGETFKSHYQFQGAAR